MKLVAFLAFIRRENYPRERDKILKGPNNKVIPFLGFIASMQVGYYMVRKRV